MATTSGSGRLPHLTRLTTMRIRRAHHRGATSLGPERDITSLLEPLMDAWAALRFLLIDDRACSLAESHPSMVDGRCRRCGVSSPAAAKLSREALTVLAGRPRSIQHRSPRQRTVADGSMQIVATCPRRAAASARAAGLAPTPMFRSVRSHR